MRVIAFASPYLLEVGEDNAFPVRQCEPLMPRTFRVQLKCSQNAISSLHNRLSADEHTKSLLQRAHERSFRWLALLQSGPAADRSVAAGPVAVEVRAGRSRVARPGGCDTDCAGISYGA